MIKHIKSTRSHLPLTGGYWITRVLVVVVILGYCGHVVRSGGVKAGVEPKKLWGCKGFSHENILKTMGMWLLTANEFNSLS